MGVTADKIQQAITGCAAYQKMLLKLFEFNLWKKLFKQLRPLQNQAILLHCHLHVQVLTGILILRLEEITIRNW